MFPLVLAATLAKIATAAIEPKKKTDQPKYSPGSKAPASGIYACADCKTKRTVSKGRRLPPCHSAWIVIEQTT
jgi:hypothetical protein